MGQQGDLGVSGYEVSTWNFTFHCFGRAGCYESEAHTGLPHKKKTLYINALICCQFINVKDKQGHSTFLSL